LSEIETQSGTTRASPDTAVDGLARFLRADLGAILAAWKTRVEALPASGPSLASRGDEPADELPSDDSFSAARAIAELALLVETIGQLEPASITGAARDGLHRVIDRAIAYSLARDGDERARLRKRLRLATDVTLVGSWEIERGSGAVRADARSCELLGMPPRPTATSEALTAQLDEGDRDRVRDAIAQALETGRSFMEECRTLVPDSIGPRWIAIAGDVHPGAVQAGTSELTPRLLGIVHDITDRKRTEAAHARVVEELSRAVHISEMFIGILSHDLRNPLGAVLAGAQLLARQVQEERSVRVLSRIVSSSERMSRMIDQLLDFTRARIGQGIPLRREAADLMQLAQVAIDELKAAAPACELRLTVRGDTTGSWDGDRVAQILSNLVGNALQHGDPACPIDLTIDGADPQVVALSIENAGVVPPDFIPVIFNPFRGTLRKRGKPNGLGLGLYVARQIALAHGGDLEVRCSATTTAFWLRLPRSAQAGKPPRQETLSEQELAAFEHLAAPLTASSVTAQMFGASPLHERAPLEHADIVERYRNLLDTALHRKAYRGHGEGIAADLRALAERLGDLGAGPREVTEVHTHALKNAVRGVPAAKTAALLSEGRLLALELMGNLASYYRRRARGYVRTERRKEEAS
jgi:signal transduction histidine kinase